MKKLITICAIVGLLAVVLGVAGTANALPITFSEFPLGTVISNQYAPQGVIFLPGNITGTLPIISMNGAMATAPVLSPQGQNTPPQFWQYAGDFSMQFTTPVTNVSFLSGYWDTVGTGVIQVYDPGLNLLTSLSNTTTGPELVSVSGLGNIGKIYFNSISDPAGADIDNLNFTSIPAPGAILLGSIGVSLVGWLRRRRTL
jgi:hypothetical protein